MASKIKHSEVVEDSLFGPEIKEGETYLKILHQLIDGTKGLAAANSTLAKDNPLRTSGDADKAIKTYREQKQVITELEKTQKKLAETESAYALELVKSKEQLRQKNVELRQQAREALAADGSVNKMAATLARLKDQYKALTDAQRSSSFGKNMLAEIQKLDPEVKELDASIGQFQRNIGNYANAFGDAFAVLDGELAQIRAKLSDPSLSGKELETLTKREQTLASVTGSLNQEFTTTRQQSRAFKEAAKQLGIELGHESAIFQKFTGQVGQGVDALRDIDDTIKLASSDTRRIDQLVGAVQGVAGAFSIAEGAAALFGDENKDLQKTFVKLQALMTITNGLQAFATELKNKDSLFTKAQIGLQKAYAVVMGTSTGAMKAFKIALISMGIGVIIIGIIALVNAMGGFDDATQETTKSQKELNEETLKGIDNLAEYNRTLSHGINELKRLAELRRAQGASDKAQLEDQKKINEAEIKELKDKNDKLVKEFLKGKSRLITKGGSEDPTREAFEKNLGYLLKYSTDADKVLIEAFIANNELIKDKENERAVLISDFSKKSTDKLKKSEDEKYNILFQVEEERIKLIGNSLNRQLAEENLSYLKQQRALKDNKDALALLEINHLANINKIKQADADAQDAAILEQQLQQAENDAQYAKDKIAAEKQVQQLIFDVYASEHQKKMEAIQKDYDEEKRKIDDLYGRGLIDREKYLQALKALDDKYKKQRDAIKFEDYQKQIAKAQQLATELNKIAERAANKRIELIDKELAANKTRQDELKALAIAGNKSAQDSIAVEEKRQKELERKKEQELKRAKRRELGLAAINTYSAKVAAGDKNALVNTIKDLTLLSAAVAAIPGFYEGTEDTGKGGKVDSKGGFVSILHPKERVVAAKENAKIGELSNEELADIAYKYNKGMLINFGQPIFSGSSNAEINYLASINSGISELVEKEPARMNWNPVEKLLTEEWNNKNNRVRIHTKPRLF